MGVVKPMTPLMEGALRHLVAVGLPCNPSNIGRAIGVKGKARSSIGYRLSAVWKGLVDRNLIYEDWDGFGIRYSATGQGRKWVEEHPTVDETPAP